MAELRLGIDIGGTGIKGAVVDLTTGELTSERIRVKTQPSHPDAVAGAVAGLVADLGYSGPIGLGVPTILIDDVAHSANNIDAAWVGTNVRTLFEDATGEVVGLANDADAAALCEARYGTARGVKGVVVVITFGTGIGSGLLHNGELVPNVEVGQLELDGHSPAEDYFSHAARESEGLTWGEWSVRVNRFLHHINALFSPSLIVVGGGVTKDWVEWSHLLDPQLGAVMASRANNTGIVGAATLVG